MTIAGLPLVMSGFNGQLAWGMTAAMGDNQDVFLEKLKRENNTLLYLVEGKWQRAAVRNETFFVKGGRPLRETVYETRHGPLLNSAFGERSNPEQPVQLSNGLGLALQTPEFKDDKSMDALFNLSRAQNVEKASDAIREIRAMALNIVFADAQHVAGRSPDASRTAAKAWVCCRHRVGTAVMTGTVSPTRCCIPMTKTRPKAGSARPTNAPCRKAMACSCPTPGITRSAPNASPNWQTAVSKTAAA